MFVRPRTRRGFFSAADERTGNSFCACLPAWSLFESGRSKKTRYICRDEYSSRFIGTRPAAVTSQTGAVAHLHSQTHNIACGVECRTSKIVPCVTILCSQDMNVVESFVLPQRCFEKIVQHIRE